MISWTITVPPTVGTAYATDSASGLTENTDAAPFEEDEVAVYALGTTSSSGSANVSTSSNGDITRFETFASAFASSEFQRNDSLSIYNLEGSGAGADGDSGNATTSWNGQTLPESYESGGYTSATRTSSKQTSTTVNFTWQAHETTTTSSTKVSGTTRTTTSGTQTLTVAATTSVTTQKTVTGSSVGNDTRNATTTASDTVTAYGGTFSVSTTTGIVTLGQSTTTQTSVSRPPTNTGFRHTATVVSLEGGEILWKPTTSGRGALSVICESYDAGRHTINRLTTATLGAELDYLEQVSFDVDTEETTVTTSTVSSQTITVAAQTNKAFPASEVTSAIVKNSSTTVISTKTGTSVTAIPVRTTTAYSTRSTEIEIDGVQVPTSALTTTENTFTVTYGTTAPGAGYTVQPWTWAKLFQAAGVGGAKALESQYFHGRGAPAGSSAGTQARAGNLSFTALATALNGQTIVAAYPTSWTQSDASKTSTISVDGEGATISTQNATTAGSQSGLWEVEGQATHQALVSNRISPAGRAPKGSITAFYGPGIFYTSANGGTGTVSVANFVTREVDPEAADRTAYRPAPLYELGFLTYDGGSYFVTTTRFDSNIIAESSSVF